MRNYLLIFLCFILPNISYAKTKLVLATGGKQGTYFALGQGIKNTLEKEVPNLEIIVLSTEGSIENAKLIDVAAAHLALVQNDVAYYSVTGERMFSFASEEIRGVIALYTETVQIIARKELMISRIQDLKGKRVSVGTKESGTEFNAATILSAVDIGYEDIDARFISFKEATDSLLTGAVDAAFMTAGIPTAAVSDVAKFIDFIAIGIDIIEKLRKTYPYFVSTNISVQSYPGQYKEIPAVGVRALLVAREDLNPDIVKGITKAILENTDLLKSAHPIAASIKSEDAMWGMTIPLHSGARDYYIGQRMIEREFTDYLPHSILFLIFILVFIFTIKWRYSIIKAISRNIYIKFALFFVVLYFIGTIGIYYSEKKVNENFRTLYESFWSTLLYILSGFEGRIPITTQGRATSILILIASMGVLGLIVGKVVSIFLKVKEVKMSKDIEKHIVICNWNEKGEKIVKELHASDAAPDTGIIVITNKRPVDEKNLRRNDLKEYSNVEFRESDPTFHQVLKGANAHMAKSVVILADDKNSDPDAESGLIALAVTSLWKQRIQEEVDKRTKRSISEAEKKEITRRIQSEREFKKPHIVVEVINHRKIEHLQDAGADEIICATDYGIGILSQCALYEKLSKAYQQLLTYSKETCEIYLLDDPKVSEWIEGKTFEEVACFLNEHRSSENPAILIGLCRGDNILLNPRKHGLKIKKEHLKFVKGDCLIVMSYEYPNLREIIQ